MENSIFNFRHKGALTTITVDFTAKDVVIVQTSFGGSKSDAITIALDQLIKIADEANEQRARNG